MPALPDPETVGETPFFADNFERLLGLHRLTAERAAELIEVSPTTVSYWRNGKQLPSGPTLRRLLSFFGLEYSSLIFTPMGLLLQRELANPNYYLRVEAKIRGEELPARPIAPAWRPELSE